MSNLSTPVDLIRLETAAPAPLPEEERLEGLMLRRLGNRIRNLRVHLQPTGLVLRGRAATYHAKQLAQHAAMELATTPLLANEIEVQ
jgi:hypothetical protein